MRGLIGTIAMIAALSLAPCARAQTDDTGCNPVPGLEAALNSPARVLWFGEVHGTTETPALFGDIVCAVAAHDNRPVVVALERTPQETEQWLAFLRADTPEPMTGFLLTGAQWRQRAQDGRNSEAMLALALRLRDMVKSGDVADVALIDDVKTPETRDADMAAAVQRAEANHLGARVVVLTGNVHAMKAPFRGMTAAAGHLSPGEVYSVAIFTGPGTRWDGTRGAVAMDGVERPRGMVAASENVLPAPLVGGYDAVVFTGTATTASAPADQAALDVTAPVHNAYATIEDIQGRMPPATSDRDRLERLYALDQTGRGAFNIINIAAIPADQRLAAWQMAADDMDAHDLADQQALKAMMPKSGWFKRSVYGDKAAAGAFFVAQHAHKDSVLMREVLKRVTPLVGTGEIDDADYARMYDRVALTFEHKLQRYGTQVTCAGGGWHLEPLEDPDHVDERRRAVGLMQTEAEYVKGVEGRSCG